MKGIERNEHYDIPTDLMRVCGALLNDQRALKEHVLGAEEMLNESLLNVQLVWEQCIEGT